VLNEDTDKDGKVSYHIGGQLTSNAFKINFDASIL